MDLTNIRYIKEWISQLPSGNITYKTINGKRYPYYQWTENGKQRSRVVKSVEIEELLQKIEQRKVLEKKIKESEIVKNSPDILQDDFYFSKVLVGDDLVEYVNPIREFKKRLCYNQIKEYICGNSIDKVFILYGLRRTGKTTLIKQVVAEMSPDMFDKAAFMQIDANISFAQVNLDLKQLAKKGYKYVFIDEVTLMSDFIESAALFSDIYSARGMKIVLSGTDSLGFAFSEDNELYDRCYMLHTTFISYKEFETVLGIKGIDNYIKYGGTMTLGGYNYNLNNTTFASLKSTKEYIDTAIAHNIQHSLRNYQQGGRFRNLSVLYEANELTSVINRIVESENKRFTIETLTKEFVSSDLGETARNLLKDSKNPSDILMLVDKEQVTEWFRKELDILNKRDMRVEITEDHVKEIREYLSLLDLIVEIENNNLPSLKIENYSMISQPGMRYAQAKALIESLAQDVIFQTFSLEQRMYAIQRMLSTIEGKMMEDIVLLETKIAKQGKKVFKLKFTIGEFDMVVSDSETCTCEIYEIKHSEEIHPKQYRHLIDEKKCQDTEFRYGKITNKYVIYRGKTTEVEGIKYLNVEEYLSLL